MLFSCLVCGGFFVDPRPSGERLKQFYETSHANEDGGVPAVDSAGQVIIPVWKRKECEVYLQWIRQAMQNEGDSQGRPVSYLDIGCQVGIALSIARDQYRWEVFGIEVWPPADEILTHQQIPHAMVSLEHMTSKKQFDVISLFDVLEHLPDIDRALEKIRQLLSRDGVLFLAVPNAHGLFPFLFHRGKYLWKKIRKKRDQWDPLPYPFHLWWYTSRGLVSALARHGFRIERIATDSTHRMMNWQRKSAAWKRALYTIIQVVGKVFGAGNRLIIIARPLK